MWSVKCGVWNLSATPLGLSFFAREPLTTCSPQLPTRFSSLHAPLGPKRQVTRHQNTYIISVLPVTDINISSNRALPTPRELLAHVPRTEAQAEFVAQSRDAIHRIIFGDDHRFLVVVGPCSIHDTVAGREYAARLAMLSPRRSPTACCSVMRVYFEKPRTALSAGRV